MSSFCLILGQFETIACVPILIQILASTVQEQLSIEDKMINDHHFPFAINLFGKYVESVSFVTIASFSDLLDGFLQIRFSWIFGDIFPLHSI